MGEIYDITLADEGDLHKIKQSSSLPTWSLAWSIYIGTRSSIETWNPKIWFLILMGIWGSQIWEFPGSGESRTIRIRVELLAICLLKSYAERITNILQIFLLSELWAMNLCWEEDHMLEKTENKSEIKFYQSKLLSRLKICPINGPPRLQIV